jgi:tetratricopeptide (TPR) repeat protein
MEEASRWRDLAHLASIAGMGRSALRSRGELMQKRTSAKWVALVIAGSCVGCSAPQGAKAPGLFASWTNPFASLTASKGPPRVDEQDDVIRLDKKPKATADFFIAAGDLAKSRGDMNNAVAQYQQAVRVEPKNVNALRHLGKQHVDMQNYTEAEKTFASAVAVAPTDPAPLNDLAICLAQQKRFDDSIVNLNKAIALRPHLTAYRNNMADVLVKSGRPREAFEHLAVVHSKADAHYNLGFLLRQEGQFDAARQHFATAAQIDPQLDAAHQALEEMGGAPAAQTVNRSVNRPAAKEVSAPRNLRAQLPARTVLESGDSTQPADVDVKQTAPKGYYDGVDEEEMKAASPAEVLAKRSKSKPVRKSAAELRAKIEDRESTTLR